MYVFKHIVKKSECFTTYCQAILLVLIKKLNCTNNVFFNIIFELPKQNLTLPMNQLFKHEFGYDLIFFTHCSAKPRIKVGTMEVVSRAFKFELCFHYRILLAGFPNMVDSGATSLKIAAPAATVLYIPTRTLSLTTEFGAICTPSSMCA